MSLQQTIDKDFKNALKAKDRVKLDTLRMLKSALKNKAIEQKREVLEEKEFIVVIQKELKKRQDAEAAFKQGNRPELAEKEGQEAEILSTYLPDMLSEDEVSKIVDEVIAAGNDNFGQVMKEVMAKAQGRTDGQLVQRLVKEKLES